MRQYSPAQIAFMTKKKKKLKGVKNRKSDDGDNSGVVFEADGGPSSIMYLLDKTVGTVNYLLHRQCAFAAENGGLFAASFHNDFMVRKRKFIV